MRLFLVIMLPVIFFSIPSWAQEDDIMKAASVLQGGLSTLQDSVDKLSVDNDQWASKDNAIKAQVLQLQTQLGALEAQGEILNNTVDKLQEKDPARAQQITRLAQENSYLDDHIQETTDAIKAIQKSLQDADQENIKLLLQLKAMQSVVILPHPPEITPEALAAIHLQKEKLRLMKMIYDSQQRQGLLHQSILDFQKNAPIKPAAIALAHQQILKEQIKDLQLQIAAFPPEKISLSSVNKWDAAQMRQLGLELKVLEKNYVQLKSLTNEMTLKVKNSRMTVAEHVEEVKLQNSLEEIKRKSVGLRADLDDLRSQMIDLDKRKSSLEEMIQHLP